MSQFLRALYKAIDFVEIPRLNVSQKPFLITFIKLMMLLMKENQIQVHVRFIQKPEAEKPIRVHKYVCSRFRSRCS